MISQFSYPSKINQSDPKVNKSKPNLSKIFTTGAWIMAVILIWLLRAPLLELLQVVKDRQAIIETVNGLGIWGPVILAISIFLQIVVAAIPGHLLIAAAGYLYGFPKGFALTWLTIILSSQFTFWLARTAGKPLVYRLASPKLIDKWNTLAEKQGIIFFLFSFNLPIFPTDVMSYVAGFSNISPRRFLFANIVGHIPVAILLNLAGAYGFELSPAAIISICVIGLAMFITWLKYVDRVEARFTRQEEV